MGCDHGLHLGSEDNYDVLQVLVRYSAPRFHRRVGSCLTRGNLLTVKHRSDLCRSTCTVSERFLLQVFSGSPNGGGLVFTLSWIYVL